ncbi:cobalt transporter [Pasteurellaceae bacterium Macca]|nr:cobalt transporter [Pasteurellaceae bacterium Macca]
MSSALKRTLSLLLFIGVAWGIYQAYPYLLFQVGEWQRHFNLVLTASLKALQGHQQQAGFTLIAVSFLYGVFHAVGPGHGKFVLSSYLSLERTHFPKAMKLTLTSALVQGLVAVALVSVIVAIFTLSRSYFNLTLKWVERGSFLCMILFGLYWCYQARPKKIANGFKIRGIQSSSSLTTFRPVSPSHTHSPNCGCGHKHLPNKAEITQAEDWKSQWMVILSIGLRPCSGAILVLFLAYTLDLYLWGVFSALAMAVGTGLTLSLFACLVLFARERALKVGKWYFSTQTRHQLQRGVKCAVGLALIVFGLLLLHSSLLETSQSLLFKR